MGRNFLISVLVLGLLLLVHSSYANDQVRQRKRLSSCQADFSNFLVFLTFNVSLKTDKKVEHKETTIDNSNKQASTSSTSTGTYKPDK